MIYELILKETKSHLLDDFSFEEFRIDERPIHFQMVDDRIFSLELSIEVRNVLEESECMALGDYRKNEFTEKTRPKC